MVLTRRRPSMEQEHAGPRFVDPAAIEQRQGLKSDYGPYVGRDVQILNFKNVLRLDRQPVYEVCHWPTSPALRSHPPPRRGTCREKRWLGGQECPASCPSIRSAPLARRLSPIAEHGVRSTYNGIRGLHLGPLAELFTQTADLVPDNVCHHHVEPHGP